MRRYECRCNTERVLLVTADDEAAARQIAEDTDSAEWDSAESEIAVEPVDESAAST